MVIEVRCSGKRGFTVIELLVVLAVVGLLVAVVAPRYTQHVDRARETALRQNLAAIRQAIDQFRADRSRYPVGIEELVSARYLPRVPLDPVTERPDTWIATQRESGEAGMTDVRSGAPGVAIDGTPYAAL